MESSDQKSVNVKDMPFKAISGADIGKLLVTLHEQRADVLFKFENSASVFRVKPEAKSWGQTILAPRPTRLDSVRKDQVVTGNFTLSNEVYFFKARVRMQRTHLHLEIIDSIQQLIRRATTRYKVPPTMSMTMYSKRFGESLIFLRGDVLDISAKGCMISLNTAESTLKVGDIVVADLRFGSRKSLGIQGVIRHLRKSPKNKLEHVFGMEFTSCEDFRRLQTWILDVQRELFRTML